jgi:hypothetical protein
MSHQPRKAFLTYWRDRSLTSNKFDALDSVIDDFTNKRRFGVIPAEHIQGIIVSTPDVLGDTYEELIANLDKLARAGLLLKMDRPSSLGS